MKAEYRKGLSGNILVLQDEYGYSFENYQVRMLTDTHIPHILKCRVQMVDAIASFHYNTQDYQPLDMRFAQRGMRYSDMRELLSEVDDAMKRVTEFLLPPEGILLEPEYIFLNSEGKYYFCYLPGREMSFSEAFQKLSEYVLNHMDYGEKEGVVLGYGIYRKSQEAQACMDSLMSLLSPSKLEFDQESDRVGAEREAYDLWLGDGWQSETKRTEPAETRSSLKKGGAVKKVYKRNDKIKLEQKRGKWTRIRYAGIFLFFCLAGIAAILRTRTINSEDAELKIETYAASGDVPIFIFCAAAIGTVGIVVWLLVLGKRKREKDEKLWNMETEPVGPTVYLGEKKEIMLHKLVRSDTQEEYDLRGDYVRIGKSASQTELTIREDTISRLHACIFSENGEWYIQDLHSTNGTFYNGKYLNPSEKQRLIQGDEIRFADLEFIFL